MPELGIVLHLYQEIVKSFPRIYRLLFYLRTIIKRKKFADDKNNVNRKQRGKHLRERETKTSRRNSFEILSLLMSRLETTILIACSIIYKKENLVNHYLYILCSLYSL